MTRPPARRLRLTGLSIVVGAQASRTGTGGRDAEPPPSHLDRDDTVEKLAGLAEMGEAGILTEAEYELAKRRLLSRPW